MVDGNNTEECVEEGGWIMVDGNNTEECVEEGRELKSSIRVRVEPTWARLPSNKARLGSVGSGN